MRTDSALSLSLQNSVSCLQQPRKVYKYVNRTVATYRLVGIVLLKQFFWLFGASIRQEHDNFVAAGGDVR